MKKIRTVWRKSILGFDSEVNELLSEGWTLVRRDVLVDPHDLSESVFYAELVLEVPDAE